MGVSTRHACGTVRNSLTQYRSGGIAPRIADPSLLLSSGSISPFHSVLNKHRSDALRNISFALATSFYPVLTILYLSRCPKVFLTIKQSHFAGLLMSSSATLEEEVKKAVWRPQVGNTQVLL